MAKYQCEACGYIYDSENNSNITLEELPDSWTCTLCGADKSNFC